MKRHTDAVVARIKNVAALASKVGVAGLPRVGGQLVPAPYVVVWPADGSDTAERFDGSRVTHNPRFTLHIVGLSYDNCQTVTELVKAEFVQGGRGVRLDIPGENTHRVRWSQPVPIQTDVSVSPPLVFNVVEVAFQSDEKASADE